LGDLGSVFGSFFGGGSPFGGNFSQTRVDNRGSSLTMRVNLSFKEAVFGVEKEVSYVKKNYCENCKGTGSADGKKDTCSVCGGSGRVRRQTQTLFGMMATESACPTCGGTGSEIKNPCSSCNGTGRVTKSVTTKIKIPAGVESGMKLRFPGKGDSGTLGGESGDLYVVLNVKEDSHFQRNNGDIYSEISIDPVLAVLGGEIDVPTVNGNVKMKLPKGTQPGKEFRLKENGGPRLRGGGIGDHFVKINVEVPNKISAEEKQLWEKLQEVRGKKSKGFWDKLLE
jgi:molecular chaperone DnaJ